MAASRARGAEASVRDYVADQNDRKAAFEDLLWALLNTKEFLFNH